MLLLLGTAGLYFRGVIAPAISVDVTTISQVYPAQSISTLNASGYIVAQRKAAVICRHCPVIAECGADALDNRVEFGVWGGMTERQRRALLKQHPEVSSWSEFFATQRKHRSVS
jgi:WhiB family redox-sensing transcriptional regulator